MGPTQLEGDLLRVMEPPGGAGSWDSPLHGAKRANGRRVMFRNITGIVDPVMWTLVSRNCVDFDRT